MDSRLEERYAVIKLNRLTPYQRDAILQFMESERIKPVDCVVIEADWPEYTPAVDMLMGRVARTPSEFELRRQELRNSASKSGLPAYNGCRLPPKGWHCTRGAAHPGPCATVRDKP
jgi:hypothetical protein